MKSTRRTFLQTGAAAAALTQAPGVLRAQPAAGKTIRAVMQGDLRAFDPIWTTANITAYHGSMIYDTLFALDANMKSQPQMVSKYGVSDDKLTYTFELRDGLKFSDGSAVTSDDVVASIRRWAARDGGGQHMMLRVKDIAKKDDKTFTIALKEPYGLVVDLMAKTTTPLLFIMRKKEAETDPMQQVTTYIGSGPFTFNQDQTKQGARYVYDKNPNYVPRQDAPTGLAGGKVVKVDRVIYDNMDQMTGVAAIQAGEIDFFELPPIDLLDQLEGDKNIKVEVLNQTGNVGWIRLNFLHPPFNNADARRAMLYLVNQEEYLKATFGNPKYYKKCGSNFACGTPMENDENTQWFKEAPNPAKAKELFQKAGYDGKPVVVLQATDHYLANPAGLLAAQWLRQAGVNVDLAAMDWGALLTRRAVKKPPAEGGWNTFATTVTGITFADPIAFTGQAANGDKAWFGWPLNELQEKLRDRWATAPTLDERKQVARELQKNGWDYIPHVLLGQFFRNSAWRKNIRGVIGMPEMVGFWNMEKTA
jgi:peptide/nickel transport system substrate-binding protein